jgi:hypothetical protein
MMEDILYGAIVLVTFSLLILCVYIVTAYIIIPFPEATVVVTSIVAVFPLFIKIGRQIRGIKDD